MSLENSRAHRFRIAFDPLGLDLFDESRAAWFETRNEIRQGIGDGRRKAVLLAWVRMQMALVLTPRERECLELYFFQGGHTYEDIGRITNTHSSSCCRAVHRAVDKLRQAKDHDDTWRTALEKIDAEERIRRR